MSRAAVLAAVAAFALATSIAAPASAQESDDGAEREAANGAAVPSPSGLRVALRTGVARPLGQAFTASGAMTDTITGYVPVRLDVGYRFARHFYVGVAAQIATIIPSGCPSGSSCSGSDARVGIMAAYHLRPTRTVDPWAGVGIGYEALSVSRTVGGSSVDISARGFEILDLELGVDLRLTRSLRVGPVLSSSIGSYTRLAVNGTRTADFDTSTHAWVMLGFRGAFDL
jgi:outer membrane protein